eukprot:881018-Amphidinium_carterae.1
MDGMKELSARMGRLEQRETPSSLDRTEPWTMGVGPAASIPQSSSLLSPPQPPGMLSAHSTMLSSPQRPEFGYVGPDFNDCTCAND